MPTIIDSLFLELGIDTSKFNKDQQRAITKIQEFEKQVTRASGKARGGIQTVGDAFRDLSKDSRVGASAAGIDNLANKLKNLGISMKVGGSEGLGGLAMGLGKLLSPAALGVAAVGLLGKGMWDLNRSMTDSNALLERQARLSGINSDNMWSWAEAAKTVGANPAAVSGGIAALQTSIMGMGIGAGDATGQLVALARLGVGFNFRTGVPIDKLMGRVHELAAAKGFQNLGGLRALTGPVMNDAMFDIATNPNYNPNDLEKQIKGGAPKNLTSILQDSLKSQTVLGRLGIAKDVLAETAYGGEQGLLAAVVQILTSILGVITQVSDFLMHPVKAYSTVVDAASRGIDNIVSASAGRNSMYNAMRILMNGGMGKADAAALVGNAMQESSMNPLATNGSHTGLFQLSKSRAAGFAKWAGYAIGDKSVSADKQFSDQLLYAMREPEYRATSASMAKVKSLMDKTKAFMTLDEKPGDNSFSKRFSYATDASRIADLAGMLTAAPRTSVQHNTSDVKIDQVHLHTPSTDPKSHVDTFINGIRKQPMLAPTSQNLITLGTRGMV